MKIVQLNAENVKRLKVVEITPDGNTVVIGGDNAQGKSSVLDAITMALAGKRAQGLAPIREGQKKAEIVVDLGEYIVTRTITQAGGNITVKTKKGASYGSPQKILDGLTSALTFDPLAFMNERPAKQVETIKGLVGLDFTEQDTKRARLFEERRNVKRDVVTYQKQFETFGDLTDVPEAPVSLDDIMAEAEAIREHNDTGTARLSKIATIEKDIDDLNRRIEELTATLDEETVKLATLNEAHQGWTPKDQGDVRQRMTEAEAINRKVEDKRRRNEIDDNLSEAEVRVEDLTIEIEAIDHAKKKAMAEADFPVPGLAFDDNGVTFNGLPFSESSSAEQLRVSVAMGIALNPELKVLLIRDGSLLDTNTMSMVAEMAKEADAQVWIERVSKGAECSVIIEDGEVAA